MPSGSYCKVWSSTVEVSPLPSEPFLTACLVVLVLASLVAVLAIKALRPHVLRRLLKNAGVVAHKVATTAREIERKTFHLCGLLVPFIYQVLLQRGVSQAFCIRLCWSITVLGCSLDMMRIHVPLVQRNWPMKSLLRDREQGQLCGGSYFSLGCTMAIHFFSPAIAMTAIIFLVLGDMSAALIGRSLGQSVCNVKIGPGGKKSVEGSVAMFMVCIMSGCVIFSQVHLREYAVFVAALVATLTELYEPFGLNDNVSIPVLSGLALTLGFARTYSCEPSHNPLLWYTMKAQMRPSPHGSD